MTRSEKIKKAVAIAVAYYLQQEKASAIEQRPVNSRTGWLNASKAIQMSGRQIFQQRGRIARPRNFFRNEESS